MSRTFWAFLAHCIVGKFKIFSGNCTASSHKLCTNRDRAASEFSDMIEAVVLLHFTQLEIVYW